VVVIIAVMMIVGRLVVFMGHPGTVPV